MRNKKTQKWRLETIQYFVAIIQSTMANAAFLNVEAPKAAFMLGVGSFYHIAKFYQVARSSLRGCVPSTMLMRISASPNPKPKATVSCVLSTVTADLVNTFLCVLTFSAVSLTLFLWSYKRDFV
jgi:hypothetical protein